MNKMNKLVLVILTAVCVIAGVSSANITTYSFNLITNNSVLYGEDVTNQLFVDIEDMTTGQVAFTFRNEGPISSSIAEIYFDDGTILDTLDAIVQDSSEVAYTGNDIKKVSPANLPSGGNLDPDFIATAYLSSDADPGNFSGVQVNEEITLIFTLVTGVDYAGVIASLDSDPSDIDNMRIGLHVRSLPDGESESYVNNGQVIVPVPGAFLLGGLGTVCVGWMKRRRSL